jgi:hypothetical protein
MGGFRNKGMMAPCVLDRENWVAGMDGKQQQRTPPRGVGFTHHVLSSHMSALPNQNKKHTHTITRKKKHSKARLGKGFSRVPRL